MVLSPSLSMQDKYLHESKQAEDTRYVNAMKTTATSTWTMMFQKALSQRFEDGLFRLLVQDSLSTSKFWIEASDGGRLMSYACLYCSEA
jgi:hypothetical protein